MSALRLLHTAALRHVAILADELRDLLGQIVEVESGHVTLNLDSDTWRNVVKQFIFVTTDYWAWLLFITILVFLIGLAITQ